MQMAMAFRSIVHLGPAELGIELGPLCASRFIPAIEAGQ